MKTLNKPIRWWAQNSLLAIGLAFSLSAQAVNNIVAVVGRQVVTQQELQQRLQQVRSQGSAQSLPADLPKQVLEALIGERAQLQAAIDMGLDVSDAEIDQAQQRVAAQNGMSVAQLLQRVREDGLSEAGYRQQLSDQLMIQRARERVLDQRLQVTPADIQAEIDRAAAQQGEPELELAQVLIAVPETASNAQRAQLKARAQEVAQRAQAGEDFSALVNAYSDARGARDGSLGLKPQGAWPSLFLDAIQALPQGGVSGVITSGAGFHVLKVLQRSRGISLALSVVQTHARHILRRAETEAQRQAATQTLQGLRADVLAGRLSFEAAARQWGEDGSAANGGDLGWAQPGQFVPAFEAAMNTLQPGIISPPVETPFGVHLIEVLARRRVPMTDAQQRDWARRQVRETKGPQVLQAWVREVRAGAYVQIQDPDLR